MKRDSVTEVGKQRDTGAMSGARSISAKAAYNARVQAISHG